MTTDQIKGSIQDVAGKVQDAVGGATGDPGLQLKGKIRQAAGQLQDSYGEAIDSFREKAVENPLTTLALVGGIGFMLGVLWSKRD